MAEVNKAHSVGMGFKDDGYAGSRSQISKRALITLRRTIPEQKEGVIRTGIWAAETDIVGKMFTIEEGGRKREKIRHKITMGKRKE